jgi:hypothetical protein
VIVAALVDAFVFQAKATKKGNRDLTHVGRLMILVQSFPPCFPVASFFFVFIPTIHQNVRRIDKPVYACDVCIATSLNYIPRIALPASLTPEFNT